MTMSNIVLDVILIHESAYIANVRNCVMRVLISVAHIESERGTLYKDMHQQPYEKTQNLEYNKLRTSSRRAFRL